MTAPRQVLPGRTYFVTRRCAQRAFFLRPSKATNALCQYLLAVAARRHHIDLHAYCFMSNHYHLVLTDHDANLPAFMQYFNSLLARSLNASIGHWEVFWDPAPYSAVQLVDTEDVVAKTAYALANPVTAGLVRSARAWPGLWSDPSDFGGAPRRLRRPKAFFDVHGTMPEEVELALITPRASPPGRTFAAAVEEALAALEQAAARRITRFLGVLKVLAQRPYDRPRSEAPRRGLRPRVASRDRWRRIETLSRLRAFVEEYRRALRSWRRNRSVTFPEGTYLMRVLHGVACAPC